MDWLTGDWSSAGAAAGKAALLFALAAIGFRINPRRTLSEYSPFDFAALLGTGAIIGRTATAKDTSFAVGAAALIALLAIHNIVSRLRFARWFSRPRLFTAWPSTMIESVRVALSGHGRGDCAGWV